MSDIRFANNVSVDSSLYAQTLAAGSILSADQNISQLFAPAALNTAVQVNSGTWNAGSMLSGGDGNGFKISSGSALVQGDLVITGRLSALSGSSFYNTTFTTTSSLRIVNSAPLTDVALYVGASGTGDIASFYDVDRGVEMLHIGGDNSTYPNIGIRTSYPNQTLTVSGTLSTSGDAWVNNLTVNGGVTANVFYGDGSRLTGIAISGVGSTSGVTSVNGLTGAITNVLTTSGGILTGSISAPSLTANTALFNTSVSAAKYYGDGSQLTGIQSGVTSGVTSVNGLTGAISNVVTTSGALFSGSISSPALSSASLTANVGQFNNSVSAVSISAGSFYGDGTKLIISASNLQGFTGVSSINGSLTGAVTSIVTTSGATLTGALIAPSLSSTSSNSQSILSAGQDIAQLLTPIGRFNTLDSVVNSSSGTWNAGSALSAAGYNISPTNTPQISGDLVIYGKLSALSGSNFFNTLVTTVTSLCVYNQFTVGYPALLVGSKGSGNIAAFYDLDQNVEVLHVGAQASGFGNVGIKTSYPSQTLTVSGTVSASSTAWFGNVYTTGSVSAAAATFNSVSATKLYGDGSSITNLADVLYTSGGTITGVNSILASPILSSQSLTATTGIFRTSLSSISISAAAFYGDGTNLTINAGNILGSTVTSVNGLTGAVTNVLTTSGAVITGASGLRSPSLSSASLTSNAGIFTISVSAAAVSATTFYGDGSKLTGVLGGVTSVNGLTGAVTNVLTTSGVVITGSSGLQSPSLSSQTLTAGTAVFTTYISSAAISGVHYGDGSKLTGIAGGVTSVNGLTGAVTNVLTTSGGTITGTNVLQSPSLSSQTLTANTALFNVSLSSAAISGVHYGDGSKLTGIIAALPANALTTSGGTVTAANGSLNTPLLSTQALTASTFTLSGYPILPISPVSLVGSGSIATYTVSLSDNNRTLVMNVTNSGTVYTPTTAVSFPTGFQFNVVQLGAGRITLSADNAGSLGTLFNDLQAYKTYKQYSAATIVNLGSNIWVTYGSLST